MMVRSAIFNARGKQKKSLYRTLRAVREDSKEGHTSFSLTITLLGGVL